MSGKRTKKGLSLIKVKSLICIISFVGLGPLVQY